MQALPTILTPGRTVCRAPGVSKKRLFETIARIISEDQSALPSDAVFDHLIAREKLGSTGLGQGIAIPHCKSAAVRQNSLCVARYRKPLDWQSRDGEPVDTVIMLIVRESDAGEAHMKIFAQLARRIMHESFRDGLRACPDERSLLQYLQVAVEN